MNNDELFDNIYRESPLIYKNLTCWDFNVDNMTFSRFYLRRIRTFLPLDVDFPAVDFFPYDEDGRQELLNYIKRNKTEIEAAIAIQLL